MLTRVRRADVSLRDVTIARDGKRRLASANDVTHRKRADDFGRFWKSQLVSWDETCLGGRRLVFACSRRPLWRVPHVWGRGRWKSQNRKIMPLSPYVEEPLKSKVIKKVSYLNWEVVTCFSNFEIPMFYVIYIYIYIYEHYMSISHIAISWLW